VTSERAVDFVLSPDENWLAFQELWQTYVCPFPHMASPLSVSPEMKDLPVIQLSSDGGTYLSWASDSRKVRWSLGPELCESRVDSLFSVDKSAADSLSKTEAPKPRVTMLGWNEAADIPSTDLYLVGAQILPMHDLSVIPNGVVHVKGNRIVEVGPQAKIQYPAGARVIDVTGKTLMPASLTSMLTPDQVITRSMPGETGRFSPTSRSA